MSSAGTKKDVSKTYVGNSDLAFRNIKEILKTTYKNPTDRFSYFHQLGMPHRIHCKKIKGDKTYLFTVTYPLNDEQNTSLLIKGPDTDELVELIVELEDQLGIKPFTEASTGK